MNKETKCNIGGIVYRIDVRYGIVNIIQSLILSNKKLSGDIYDELAEAKKVAIKQQKKMNKKALERIEEYQESSFCDSL